MKLTVLLTLLFFSTFSYSQSSVISIYPLKPEVGDKVNITYSGPLVNENIKIAYICHSLDKRYNPIRVIPAYLNNNQLQGEFIIPDSTAFFTIKVYSIDEIDNNDKRGFGFYVYEDGEVVKGAYFCEGNSIRLNKYYFEGENDPERAIFLMEKEYKLYPDLKELTIYPYSSTLASIPERRGEVLEIANNQFNLALETGNGGGGLYPILNILADGNFLKADSLRNVITEKYPLGELSLSYKMNLLEQLYYEMPDTTISIYHHIKKEYINLTLQQLRHIDSPVLLAFVQKGDFQGFEHVINSLISRDSSSQALFIIANSYNELASEILSNSDNLNDALRYSENSLKFHSKNDTLSRFYGNALSTYAKILYRLGRFKEVIPLQKKAIYLTDGKDSRFKEDLIKFLLEDKQYNYALNEAERFILEGESSMKVEELYKTAFMLLDGDPNAYLNARELLYKGSEKFYRSEIKEKFINKPAPNLVLMDINGNEVNLTDHKGKIIILDFWATWCGPCIKAFPAMKKTMKELKDKNVEFLFINTLENQDSNTVKEKIHKIIEKFEIHDFKILLDYKEVGNYATSKLFGVEGIPAKFVIDKSGNIRYKSLGFANDKILTKELTTVVSLLGE